MAKHGKIFRNAHRKIVSVHPNDAHWDRQTELIGMKGIVRHVTKPSNNKLFGLRYYSLDFIPDGCPNDLFRFFKVATVSAPLDGTEDIQI